MIQYELQFVGRDYSGEIRRLTTTTRAFRGDVPRLEHNPEFNETKRRTREFFRKRMHVSRSRCYVRTWVGGPLSRSDR